MRPWILLLGNTRKQHPTNHCLQETSTHLQTIWPNVLQSYFTKIKRLQYEAWREEHKLFAIQTTQFGHFNRKSFRYKSTRYKLKSFGVIIKVNSIHVESRFKIVQTMLFEMVVFVGFLLPKVFEIFRLVWTIWYVFKEGWVVLLLWMTPNHFHFRVVLWFGLFLRLHQAMCR